MATKLTKPLVREVDIDEEAFLVSLIVEDGEPLVTFRKKGSRGAPSRYLLRNLLEDSQGEEVTPTLKHDMIPYEEVMSKLGALLSKEAEPLEKIVRDIFEVNVLASDLSDAEVVEKGVALPE